MILSPVLRFVGAAGVRQVFYKLALILRMLHCDVLYLPQGIAPLPWG